MNAHSGFFLKKNDDHAEGWQKEKATVSRIQIAESFSKKHPPKKIIAFYNAALASIMINAPWQTKINDTAFPTQIVDTATQANADVLTPTVSEELKEHENINNAYDVTSDRIGPTIYFNTTLYIILYILFGVCDSLMPHSRFFHQISHELKDDFLIWGDIGHHADQSKWCL